MFEPQQSYESLIAVMFTSDKCCLFDLFVLWYFLLCQISGAMWHDDVAYTRFDMSLLTPHRCCLLRSRTFYNADRLGFHPSRRQLGQLMFPRLILSAFS